MANRSYKSILHNKKELHENHTTHVEEIKEEQATEAADTTAEKVSEEKPAEKKCFFSFLKPGENRKKVPFILLFPFFIYHNVDF